MFAAEELRSWLRLTLIAGIGGATQRQLLAAFVSPQGVFAATRSDLRALTSARIADLLLATDNSAAVDAACAWAQGDGQRIVTLADSEYPQALLQIADPPTLLYVRGRFELLNRASLAIVGSRSPTPQGLVNARAFAAALSEAGLTIVSGLALGIDAAAHRGALDAGGDTIAFIGTGIDRVYPARNHELALAIGEKGCIVSEFALGTPVLAANFPRRNRLLSGIARGVLIVEAALASGSLITARLAGEQGREVFAIPGSIHSPLSRGCHRLLRDGAKLVETAADVLDELNWTSPAGAVAPMAAGDPGVEELLPLLGFDPFALDELAARCGRSTESLALTLLQLELDGQVALLPGGRYQRLAGTA